MKYDFVEIAGKKYPIKFGFNALRRYGILTNTSLQDLNKLGNGEMQLDQALTLILCGLEDGYRAAKQPCDLDIETLSDLVDEDFELIEKCMTILADQMGGAKGGKQKANKAKKR